MNITFRTDASIQIGTGHVMRCLTLADALKEQGAICHFICREHEGNLIELIKSKGHAVTALSLDCRVKPDNDLRKVSYSTKTSSSSGLTGGTALTHAHWLGTTQEQDAEQTIAALQIPSSSGLTRGSIVQTDWLIIDHYALDHTWETALAPYAKKILVIDDLADRKHHCHILLDQNLGKTPADYQNLVPENCALLLGPEYALLQPQYAELHPRTPPRQGPIKNILVYFGGSDQHNLTGMAVQAFLQLDRPDIQLSVVMGSSYPHKEKLQQLAQAQSHIQLYQNLPSLAPLMLQADLAIGAGGSTSWERCCLGLPAVLVTLAANQVPIAQELQLQQIAHWLGNFEDISPLTIQQALSNILNNHENVEAWSRKCLSIVNGQGTNQVAGYLLLRKITHLYVRHAELKDEQLLLDWVNDPMVRLNAFNSEPIVSGQHQKWFHAKLRQPDICKIFIVQTEHDLPVGQVRFDWSYEKQAWVIDYSVSAPARGNGLGSKILQLALEQLRKQHKGALVIGEVKEQNLASRNTFERLQFEPKNAGGGYCYMLRC